MKTSTQSSKIFIGLLSFITGIIISSNIYAAKLYKWVDKDGNISYQDQPPPESAKILKEDTIETIVKSSESALGNSEPVVVYVVEDCPACDTLVARLTELGLTADKRVLSDDRDAQREILDQLSEVTVPTMFLGGKYISDINATTLPEYLKEAGYMIGTQETDGETTPAPNAQAQ